MDLQDINTADVLKESLSPTINTSPFFIPCGSARGSSLPRPACSLRVWCGPGYLRLSYIPALCKCVPKPAIPSHNRFIFAQRNISLPSTSSQLTDQLIQPTTWLALHSLSQISLDPSTSAHSVILHPAIMCPNPPTPDPTQFTNSSPPFCPTSPSIHQSHLYPLNHLLTLTNPPFPDPPLYYPSLPISAPPPLTPSQLRPLHSTPTRPQINSIFEASGA
ncbi:hypothetical protein Pmani_039391 [Petrolisthes manimaculis]|uniref:Uncharacterized protein n=1 Tax=Petrolisthes manimaculis TaxID=1843537 RepID=A0AAE1TJL4_9EUCA|nr:hypothetical protein Pmani_039391 [Petrolisthes manimaculis]